MMIDGKEETSMIKKMTLEERGAITQEEIEMLGSAKNLPIVFDEDSPELTEEDLKGFHRGGKLGRGLAQVQAGQGIVKTM